jgi:hypothetical protein
MQSVRPLHPLCSSFDDFKCQYAIYTCNGIFSRSVENTSTSAFIPWRRKRMDAQCLTNSSSERNASMCDKHCVYATIASPPQFMKSRPSELSTHLQKEQGIRIDGHDLVLLLHHVHPMLIEKRVKCDCQAQLHSSTMAVCSRDEAKKQLELVIIVR